MTAPVLAFDIPGLGRHYRHPARAEARPSITNIIDMKNKSGLKYWAAKKSATYAAENRETLATLTKEQAYTLVREAPFQRRDDSASAIGNIVHNWIDRYVKGDLVTGEEIAAAPQTARWMWERFLKFTDYYAPHGLTFIESEFTVWSDTYGYAGTGDLHATVNGHSVLVDTKTGARTYPETAMQLAALARADFILSGDGQERPIPAYDKYAILHLRPRSFTLQPVFHIDKAFDAFLNLKGVFDWGMQYADETLGFSNKVTSLTQLARR